MESTPLNPVQKMQSKLGLNPDGVIGKVTLQAFARHHKLSHEQAAHFFGQTDHETGGFKLFTENLNYSAKGLLTTFKKYFTPDTANKYQRQPEKIANKVYADRMGNGSELSGDGFRYRGRGALQLTGKSNYQAFANFLNDPTVLSTPELVSTDYAFESALFFFQRNSIWAIAKEGINDLTIGKITKKINGGFNGLDDRKAQTLKYYKLIKG